MERVRVGDHDAYGALVRRHTAIALRAAVAMGAGPDAEDVVQEAFVKAYRSFGTFRPGAGFRPWLLSIVANESRNLHRSARRRTDRERRLLPGQAGADRSLDPPGVSDPADAVLTGERLAVLRAGLERLGAAHRDVLVCRYLLELDEKEAAQTLGISIGTVKSRSHRALRRLKAQLPDLGSTHDR